MKNRTSKYENLLRQGMRERLDALPFDYKTTARRLRRILTEPVNDADDLISDGYIQLRDEDGNEVSPDDYDGDAGHGWTISLDGWLLLHVYQPKWLATWQTARGRRN